MIFDHITPIELDLISRRATTSFTNLYRSITTVLLLRGECALCRAGVTYRDKNLYLDNSKQKIISQ